MIMTVRKKQFLWCIMKTNRYLLQYIQSQLSKDVYLQITCTSLVISVLIAKEILAEDLANCRCGINVQIGVGKKVYNHHNGTVKSYCFRTLSM